MHYLQKKAIYISIYNIKCTYRHEAITYKSMAVTVLFGNVMVGIKSKKNILVALKKLISIKSHIVFCIHSDRSHAFKSRSVFGYRK